MTLYFSEKNFIDEIVEYLRKDFPRGEISSNSLEIRRADTIDEKLFLKYFTCAVAKEGDLYKAMISLPDNLLAGQIPFWYTKENEEILIDPKSGPRGKDIYNENVFTVKFHFYVDEKKIKSFDETKNLSTDEALIAEFIEIRHAIIEGNMEPLEVFKSFYQDELYKEPRHQTSKYLSSILKKRF